MQIRLFSALLVATTLLLSLTQPCWAQTANNQDTAVKVKTELLQLRAVVTDKKGNLLEGLQAEDFELLENNRPQKIEFFSRQIVSENKSTNATGAAASTETVNAQTDRSQNRPTPARTIALFVDNVHLTFDSLDRTKQTLRRFVNEQMTESDLVCIVTAAGSAGIVNQFTQDRQLLLRAIEKLRLWRVNDSETLFSPYLAARIASDNPEALVLGMMIFESENPAMKGMSPSILESEIKAKASLVLAEASYQRKTLLSTLKAITTRLTELPGQKLLFFFSDGFSLAGNGGSYDSDDLSPAISRAVQAGVVFYTFGAQGLTVSMLSAAHAGIVEGGKQYILPNRPGRSRTPVSTPSIQSYLAARNTDQRTGMTALALDTGGKPYNETNDLNSRIAQALEENRIYYSLSYYPEDLGNPNKPRKLTLKVKGHPDYEVRSQRSFVPAELGRKEKEAASLTPRQRLARAMVDAWPVNALGVSLNVDYFERENDANRVFLQTFIESDQLDYHLEGGAHHYNLEVATAVYDSAGKFVDGWTDSIRGEFKPEQLEAAKRAGFQQSKWLALKPGLYQLAVGILEPGTERLGTAKTWLEVPKLGQDKLQISSLMLKEQSDLAQVSAMRFQQGVRLYQRGEVLGYLLRVYTPNQQKKPDDGLVYQTQIVQGDRIVFQSQWLSVSERAQVKDKISSELGGELKLNTIKPGVYELRVLVKEKSNVKPLQRSVPFSVEP